jgi:hypothetical protein
MFFRLFFGCFPPEKGRFDAKKFFSKKVLQTCFSLWYNSYWLIGGIEKQSQKKIYILYFRPPELIKSESPLSFVFPQPFWGFARLF